MVAFSKCHIVAAETNSAGGMIAVTRYIIAGNSVLTQKYIDSVFGNAVGTNVPLQKIQTDIARVWQFCDRLNYPVQITIPAQTIINRTVRVEVNERPTEVPLESNLVLRVKNGFTLYSITSPSPKSVEAEGWAQNQAAPTNYIASVAGGPPAPTVRKPAPATSLPGTGGSTNSLPNTLAVNRYVIDGREVLPPKVVAAMLANAIGTNVDLALLQGDIGRLQQNVDAFGYHILVTVPAQTITNGLVHVAFEDVDPLATGTNAVASPVITRGQFNVFTPPTTNTPGYFQVNGYRVEGNTILPPARFNLLTNYTGALNVAGVRAGLVRLQEEYHDLGYPTVSVVLPKQKLTNGIVIVKVFEGKISEIVVKGNHYYSAANVRRALPDLQTNILLNTKWFEPELDVANGSQDRQIYPEVGPGPDPGTTAVTLRVKDQLPLHGQVAVNNQATPGTPPLRVNTALQYDNLWQRDQQAGFQASFSPQEFTSEPVNFYDEPAVASYSGFYRVPLEYGGGLRELYEHQPVDFGYDEATHRFNLPPTTGNPELVFYASHSVADAGTDIGPTNVLSQTSSLLVNNQTYEHTTTENEGLGFRLVQPLPVVARVQSSLTAGLDFKYFLQRNYTTNITIADDLSNDESVAIIITNNPLNEVYYLPLAVGWSGSVADAQGVTSFSANDNLFLSELASDRAGFEAVAGSKHAGGDYTTATASLGREQKLPADWSASFKASGQWANEPLISNEQMPLGGVNGVRGYQEAEAYGDTGWLLKSDVHAPAWEVGEFETAKGGVPAELRTSVFMDYGQANSLASSASIKEWGTGIGFFLTVGEHFNARCTVARALESTPLTGVGTTRVYFSVGAQF